MNTAAESGEASAAAAISPGRADAGDFKVLVAGAGVGGLEAVLALREISDRSLEIAVLSPEPTYRPAPLSVLEPFGGSSPREVPLAEFCAEQGAELIEGALQEVWPSQHRVLTDDGTELFYDALLLSMGARRQSLAPEAINFRGSADVAQIVQLAERGRAQGGRIAFVAPPELAWTLPIYELALLFANQLEGDSAEIEIVSHETSPLEVFGPSASVVVADLLESAEIRFQGGVVDPLTHVEDLEPERIVTLPRLIVEDIPGIPQRNDGFIAVDAEMGVEGAVSVWAVGDITWSPIKQGGLATQQADVAAAAIAAAAGHPVEIPVYVPVLRAALMTADGPYYLRSGTPDADGELRAPLWWPPAKVAGRLLAPYLSKRLDPLSGDAELQDLAIDERRDEDHREAHDLALRWADLDAREGDLRRALHWLDVAEGLDLALPAEAVRKREEWRQRLQEG